MANHAFLDRLRTELRLYANPEKAPAMQAYMKSAVPYLGVSLPQVRTLTTTLCRSVPFGSVEDLASTATELWRGAEFREEKYAATIMTGTKLAKGQLGLLPLYEEMIRTGAWWDHVDGVAHRICDLLQAHRSDIEPVVRRWSVDADFWFRRSAIISQLGAKEATDETLLADVIIPNMADKEFFIRKAIGWGLREYAKSDPKWVRSFVSQHETELSPLSKREALKNAAV